MTETRENIKVEYAGIDCTFPYRDDHALRAGRRPHPNDDIYMLHAAFKHVASGKLAFCGNTASLKNAESITYKPSVAAYHNLTVEEGNKARTAILQAMEDIEAGRVRVEDLPRWDNMGLGETRPLYQPKI